MIGLKYPYPGIEQAGAETLGGNQRMLKSKTLQQCGCGVIAALDLVRYLHLYDSCCRTSFFAGIEDTTSLPLPVYDLCALRMMRNFVPVQQPTGTASFLLAAGLNRYFKEYGLALQASWGVPKERLWVEIEEMLQKNLPVILSLGKQFPKVWRKEGVRMYRYQAGQMKKSVQAHGHYVTVVAMSERWMKVLSWGQVYYISRDEFLRYRDRESLNLLCNIVRLHSV